MANIKTLRARISIDLRHSSNEFFPAQSLCVAKQWALYLLSCLYRAGCERLARILRRVTCRYSGD